MLTHLRRRRRAAPRELTCSAGNTSHCRRRCNEAANGGRPSFSWLSLSARCKGRAGPGPVPAHRSWMSRDNADPASEKPGSVHAGAGPQRPKCRRKHEIDSRPTSKCIDCGRTVSGLVRSVSPRARADGHGCACGRRWVWMWNRGDLHTLHFRDVLTLLIFVQPMELLRQKQQLVVLVRCQTPLACQRTGYSACVECARSRTPARTCSQRSGNGCLQMASQVDESSLMCWGVNEASST